MVASSAIELEWHGSVEDTALRVHLNHAKGQWIDLSGLLALLKQRGQIQDHLRRLVHPLDTVGADLDREAITPTGDVFVQPKVAFAAADIPHDSAFIAHHDDRIGHRQPTG